MRGSLQAKYNALVLLLEISKLAIPLAEDPRQSLAEEFALSLPSPSVYTHSPRESSHQHPVLLPLPSRNLHGKALVGSEMGVGEDSDSALHPLLRSLDQARQLEEVIPHGSPLPIFRLASFLLLTTKGTTPANSAASARVHTNRTLSHPLRRR